MLCSQHQEVGIDMTKAALAGEKEHFELIGTGVDLARDWQS
jgi:hypothetical protein